MESINSVNIDAKYIRDSLSRIRDNVQNDLEQLGLITLLADGISNKEKDRFYTLIKSSQKLADTLTTVVRVLSFDDDK